MIADIRLIKRKTDDGFNRYEEKVLQIRHDNYYCVEADRFIGLGPWQDVRIEQETP
jgi:hypothetical protein